MTEEVLELSSVSCKKKKSYICEKLKVQPWHTHELSTNDCCSWSEKLIQEN